MIIVNGWKPLTIITKCSILDVAAVLDPPLLSRNLTHQTNADVTKNNRLRKFGNFSGDAYDRVYFSELQSYSVHTTTLL